VSTVAASRAKRRKTAAEQKARRQKVFLAVLAGVLGLMLVFQGPKLLDALGDDEPVAAPLPAPVVPEKSPAERRAFRALPQGPGEDPFVTRSVSDRDPQAASIVSGPSGTRDPFAGSATPAAPAAPAARAPAPEAAPAPIAGQIVVGTPQTPNAVAERGWIVILASIRTSAGQAYAQRVASIARSRRVGPVSVLDSSSRKPLRAGYYVVYTGPFDSLGEVQRSASKVRSSGYRTAYVREILRYSSK
jgi:hypothetical protein